MAPPHAAPAVAPADTTTHLSLFCPAGLACVGSFSNLLFGSNWGPDQLAEALQDPGVCTVAVEEPNFGAWWIQARALDGIGPSCGGWFGLEPGDGGAFATLEGSCAHWGGGKVEACSFLLASPVAGCAVPNPFFCFHLFETCRSGCATLSTKTLRCKTSRCATAALLNLQGGRAACRHARAGKRLLCAPQTHHTHSWRA